MSFKVVIDTEHLSIMTDAIRMKMDGPMHHAQIVNICEQYLGGEDLQVFRTLIDAFGTPGRVSIEYDDEQLKRLDRPTPA